MAGLSHLYVWLSRDVGVLEMGVVDDIAARVRALSGDGEPPELDRLIHVRVCRSTAMSLEESLRRQLSHYRIPSAGDEQAWRFRIEALPPMLPLITHFLLEQDGPVSWSKGTLENLPSG